MENYARRKKQFWKQQHSQSTKKGSKSDQGKNLITCHECGKQGHTRSNCPFLKKKSNKTNSRKKAMTAWDDEDDDTQEEELEQELANFCFMAQEEHESSYTPSLTRPASDFKIETSLLTLEQLVDNNGSEIQELKRDLERFKMSTTAQHHESMRLLSKIYEKMI
ncbi:zf-CCHC domain-containing protein [Senna tora]|uniref:Zf-CCHC domain-containing protein n=1 Tax=Senna tora TaxID=362788 RepID=A0A834SR83_9FABA|nr:zf-CCHC domain-containing protein [Senna tora]